MRVVITVGGSIIIKDHDYKRFQGYSRVLKSMAEEHQIMVVVGGGRTARDYIAYLAHRPKSIAQNSPHKALHANRLQCFLALVYLSFGFPIQFRCPDM